MCRTVFINGVSKANDAVPPFGHAKQLRVFIDPDLLQWPEV